MPVTVTFHDSQYPAQITAQVHQGLLTRRLPGKLLYDSPAQAQRWLTYHQAYSPSRTEPELLGLYQQAFRAAVPALPASPLHYMSLGCGGGTKDALFLQQALSLCPRVHFTPMDASAALVVETMLRVQQTFPHLHCAPLVVDLAGEPDLEPWLAQQETGTSSRVLTCFGMLPNFDYQTFLPYLRRLMRPTDLLLLSANLSPTPYPVSVPRILPQYDNSWAHAWFTGLLDSLGFAASQVHLTVTATPLQPDGHLWQIRADARVLQSFTLALDGAAFPFAAGEVLQVFFSTRFTPQVMPQLLAAAGLVVTQSWLLASHEEGIYLCTALA